MASGKDTSVTQEIVNPFPSEEREKRVRSLTEKGTAMFELACNSYSEQIKRVVQNLEARSIPESVDQIDNDAAFDELKNKRFSEYRK